MRRIGVIGHLSGGSALSLAAALMTHNNQPQIQATQGRHRGRELAVKAARQQGKTEQA